MRTFFIFLIVIYRIFISGMLKQMLGVNRFCRFSPTCSEYTMKEIKQYGILRGLKRGIIRLSHCHPFSKQYGHI